MEAFTKVICIGARPKHTVGAFSTFCKIEWDGVKLSITGVEGPRHNGDAYGSCGQIVMGWTEGYNPATDWTFAPGWDQATFDRFVAVWDRWHLNDMKAGTAAQEEALRAADWNTARKDHKGSRGYPDHYEWALATLTAAGLQPDPANGYSYGSKWLKEEVPSDVLEFLKGLPDTDKEPAWV